MKPNELIKILDSGVVSNLRIIYCGGHIDVDPKNAPFELPDYKIAKLWAVDRGGVCVLLADGIAAEREFEKDDAPDKLEIDDLTANNAVNILNQYCDETELCSDCIFFRNNQCQITNILNNPKGAK